MKSIFQRRRTWHRKQRQSAVLIPRNQVRQLRKENGFCIQRVSKKIRNRAYEIYLQRGAQPGYEVEDWLQAERELST